MHKGYRNLKDESDGLANNICSCKQQTLTTQLLNEPRKRHNATQTPTTMINWEQRSAERRSRKNELPKPCYCCEKHCTCTTTASKRKGDCCNCSEVQRYQHHCQHNVAPTSRCCCSLTHHSHFYSRHPHAAIMPGNDKDAATATPSAISEYSHWPICAKDRSFKRHKRCTSGRHYRPPHMYHLHKKHCSSVGHLPNTYTKSSFDSSDDPNQRLSSSAAMQEIAIEIDAATMTEDNTTTATSNFAFKMAADSALAPIIRAPLHVDSDDGGRGKRQKRRSSLNSNTTIETDELSNEDVMDNDVRTYGGSGGRCYCHCCDHTHMEEGLAIRPIQNECVKIKRKRFIAADDYCSSCSRCSSCSCSHVHSSSCSSFEEWPLEGRHSTRSAPHGSHAFTVSADCHRCHPHRQTSQTSTEDLEDQEHDLNGDVEEEVQPQPLVQETTDSSARTSRRSSVSISFCSCNSNTCCCGSCDDTHTTHMCTARDATIASLTLGKLGPFEGEEGHSSTLTPLTNPSSVASTPGDEGDVTIRSLSNAFSEDTSSQSHSAEYFSLSSTNQISQGTPRKLPTNSKQMPSGTASNTGGAGNTGIPNVAVIDTTANTMTSQGDDTNGHKGRKPCKHYSKHHRHKRSDSPVDSYL